VAVIADTVKKDFAITIRSRRKKALIAKPQSKHT
jgi:hypothetical protein